jgi:hypothetical protein
VTLVPSKIATTINQLSANQAALLQQMAAMTLHAPPTMPHVGLLLLLGVATTKVASIRAAASTKDTADTIVVTGDVYMVTAKAAATAHPLQI